MSKAPFERSITVRQELIELLKFGEFAAVELSKRVQCTEKEIYDHLEQIGRQHALTIQPAECLKCGFVFDSRKRVHKPSKCPECKHSHIDPPLFSL